MVKDGRFIQIGSAADLILRPANDFVADFTRDADRSRVLCARDIMSAPVSGEIALSGKRGGTIRIDDAMAASAGGAARPADMQVVAPQTPLGNIVQSCRSDGPIIVRDGARIVGALTRDHLLDMIGGAS